MYAYIYTHLPHTQIYVCVCARVYVCVCVYLHMHTHTYIIELTKAESTRNRAHKANPKWYYSFPIVRALE